MSLLEKRNLRPKTSEGVGFVQDATEFECIFIETIPDLSISIILLFPLHS